MSLRVILTDHLRESRLVNDRLIFAAFFAIILFMIVIVRLVVLQIMEYEYFDSLSDKNHVDIGALPPQRGLIFDRNGVILAENIPTFSLELIPEKVIDIDNTLSNLAMMLSLSADSLTALKQRINKQRRFNRVVVQQLLTEKEVASLSVNLHRFPGVDIVGRLIRHYPHGNLFAHTVGYVGRINERDQETIDEFNYKGTMQIGKTGVERYYEKMLHGIVGHRKIETNVQGRVVRESQGVASLAGDDLFLHLDLNLQRVASNALGDYKGSVVALDPRTGGVLAMVSKPDFDPNDFVTGISKKEYIILRDSTDRPLFDRTLRGYYPPGSTLKPFVALAGLEFGVVDEHTKTFDPGWFILPGQDHRYRCWKDNGHGYVDLKTSIAQSCDVYFYNLANALGIDRMHNFLDLFGFGHRTGIDLPGESKGLSPSRQWKRINRNLSWYPGETLISGIGQGFNQTTPIQLAQAAAILAMRGINTLPQVLLSRRKSGENKMQLQFIVTTNNLAIVDSKNWKIVIDSMVEVVHGEHGTARHIGIKLPFNVAGKTGTAQVFGIKQGEEYDTDGLAKKLHDHALFIAFAPAERPEFVVAIVVENGGSGSKIAAPIARKIIKNYFGMSVNEQSV
ncbi:MAG: penicillin-binding protein 2 [Piscirickettsiaceae bacterium]|nr:penicillin-binding protein 2 [Piscirickettsiaceae bacterium]